MSFWNSFWLRIKRNRALPFGKTDHVIKFAFEDAGIKYYEFDTTANLPWKRGLKFLSIYNELDMRCDRFYLNGLLEAMGAQFKKPKVGFEEMRILKMLIDQTRERLNFVYQEDLVYKIASVVFFDANENPNDWEWKYALEKIERWKKSGTATDFFLHEPIQRLLPFLKDSNLTSLTYLEQLRQLDNIQLENIFTNWPGSQKSASPTFTERYFSMEMKASSPK